MTVCAARSYGTTCDLFSLHACLYVTACVRACVYVRAPVRACVYVRASACVRVQKLLEFIFTCLIELKALSL